MQTKVVVCVVKVVLLSCIVYFVMKLGIEDHCVQGSAIVHKNLGATPKF